MPEEFLRVFEACDRLAPHARDRHNANLLAHKTLVTAFCQIEPVVQPDYTKSRDERARKVGRTPENYRVTPELMRQAKPDCLVFHSLPRMDELDTRVDATRHAFYWQEAFNAVVTKMALLALVLGAVE